VSTLKAFGWIAIVEAISWLALIVAMFFKYVVEASWGESTVRLIGQIHGFLVIVYIALLFLNHVQRKWPLRKTAIDFIALVIPGAGFWVGKNAFAEDRLEATDRGQFAA
jgi:integral membrane protein